MFTFAQIFKKCMVSMVFADIMAPFACGFSAQLSIAGDASWTSFILCDVYKPIKLRHL